MKKPKKNISESIIPIAIVLAIALLVLNNFIIYGRGIKVAEAEETVKEQLRPAELQLVKLIPDNCDSCFDVEKAVEELKSQNVNITIEETISSDAQQGKDLISEYNIQKLPTIIVSGEINKSERLANFFEQKGEILEERFMYTALTPPYFDVLSAQIRGKVQIRHLVDSSCKECTDLSLISATLKQQGMFVQDEQFVEYDSDEGQELIKKFSVREIPAVLISEEVDYYPDITNALLQSGATKKEGFYAVHSTAPPYRDLAQDRIVGLVDVVYLMKEDCPACYDVAVNRNILLRFGLVLNKENTYDIDSEEGKQLVQKYGLNKVPIIILSPDAQYYPSLGQVWKSVGSIEDDGWFVMRNPEVIGAYWDIEQNKIVGAKQ